MAERQTRALSSIRVGYRYRKDLGDLDNLMASIREVGLLHPVVITRDGSLVAGQRRLEACKRLGWTDIPVHVVQLEAIVRGEYAENAIRKDFLPSEIAAIARALRPIEAAAAQKRQGTRTDCQPAAKFAGSSWGSTRNKLAQFAGTSGWTLSKIEKVCQVAEQQPDKFGHLVEEMDRTGRVNGVFRKLQVIQQAEAIVAEPPPLPAGPFRVIVADPPWPYTKRGEDPTHRGTIPYPAMSLAAIKSLPVRQRAAQDAILWLWTTNAFMEAAYSVVRAWGFEPKTILTWVKQTLGVGDWLRGKTEHCLLAVCGKPVVTLTNQSTVIFGQVREHSRKPEEFYQLVEALCPGSKVELFARQTRPGWATYGDQTTLFDTPSSSVLPSGSLQMDLVWPPPAPAPGAEADITL